MSPDWFPGEGRHADDEAFLARLRTRAAVAGVGDAEPGSSWAGDAGGLVAACVRVPGVPVEGLAPDLQVGLARDTTGWVLLGQWAVSDHVLDLPETIEIDDVRGLPEDWPTGPSIGSSGNSRGRWSASSGPWVIGRDGSNCGCAIRTSCSPCRAAVGRSVVDRASRNE